MGFVSFSPSRSGPLFKQAEESRPSLQAMEGFIPSHLVPSQTTKASSTAESLLGHVKLGEGQYLMQKAAFLLLLAEKEVPNDPLLVVQHLIDAISSDKATGLDLEVKKGLAKALHRYVDLTVIFQSEKKILGRQKETFYEKLEEVISLLNDKDLEENSVRFSLESALAGLNTLKDTSTKMQGYLIKIVQVSATQDLGGAIQLLQEVLTEKKRAHSSSWYIELLLLRLLEPLALHSEELLSEFLTPLPQRNDWQLFYGVAKAVGKLAERGPSPSTQKQALDHLGEMASVLEVQCEK